MPVRMEKRDWEHVSPVTVGTGKGCVSDEMSEGAGVKVEGWTDVLLVDKAARDASLDLMKNERRSLAGKSVGGDVMTATLGAEAVTVCQITNNKQRNRIN
jgi:hypothetical protein